MAEGYIVRRGGISGNISLNIYSGDSLPESEVGVFAQITDNIDNRVVVPTNISSAGSWSIGYQSTPTTGRICYPAINGENVYLQYTNRQLYSHNTNTDIYTLLTTNSNQAAWTLGALCYNNGIIYSFVTATSGNNVNGSPMTLYEYSIKSNLWSQQSMSYTVCGISGATMYNQKIYLGVALPSRIADSLFSYDIDTKILSNISNSPMFSYGYGSKGFVRNNNILYMFGGYQTGTDYNDTRQQAGYWNLDTGVYNTTSNPYSSSYAFNPVYCGTLIGEKLVGFISGNSNTISLQTNNLNGQWAYDSELTSPLFVLSAAQGSQVANIGSNWWVYGCSNSGNGVMMYSTTGNVGSFPKGTIVVECGTNTNHAEIISGDEQSVTINVKNVYYSNGSTLSVVPGKVRVSGGEWTDIVN